jgi:hypothetical protein
MGGALTGLVILIIGDSHMLSMLAPLHGALASEGAEVHSYSQCASSAADWVYKVTAPCRAERHNLGSIVYGRNVAPTWTLSELAAQHHPGLVIVELGDTMAGYGRPELPKPWIEGQVKELVGRIASHNISCVWIGPTWGDPELVFQKTEARVREMSDFLSQIVHPCGYVDSTKFARPGDWPTVDGQDLTATGYRKWGSDIARRVVQMKGRPAKTP